MRGCTFRQPGLKLRLAGQLGNKENIMQKLQFSIAIRSPKETVWKTLWEDQTLRDWASIIDEGIYMTGDLKEGNEVQFVSANNTGVTSLVDQLTVNEFVSFRHMMDTQDGGERKKEWTGGTESYSLTENRGVTVLTTLLDVPPGQEETFKVIFPKALERVKVLAEKKK